MYFADTSSSNSLSIYKGLLDKYLEEKTDTEIKKFFENIILTTHNLITGKISEQKVDHTIYHLVVSLSDFKKEFTRKYFEGINPNNIGVDQLRTLSSILASLISIEHEPA